MAEFKLGTVSTLAGPVTIPEICNEPVVLFSVDDDYRLYAVPEDIYEVVSFKPNDNICFILKCPKLIPLNNNNYQLIIVKGITFIKKYKEVKNSVSI